MAGGFDIHLDEDRAAKLKAAAERLGLEPADYAIALIDAGLGDRLTRTVTPDPAIDRAILERMKSTGEGTQWADVRDRLRAHLGDRPARIIGPDPGIDEAIADAVERGDEPTVSLDVFRQQLRDFGTSRD